MAIRIRYVGKTESNEPHSRIKNVGGVNNNGTQWNFSQEQIIHDIESGEYQYYVRVDEKPVFVTVAESPEGKKYIKTEQDADHPDTLLDLPGFP